MEVPTTKKIPYIQKEPLFFKWWLTSRDMFSVFFWGGIWLWNRGLTVSGWILSTLSLPTFKWWWLLEFRANLFFLYIFSRYPFDPCQQISLCPAQPLKIPHMYSFFFATSRKIHWISPLNWLFWRPNPLNKNTLQNPPCRKFVNLYS